MTAARTTEYIPAFRVAQCNMCGTIYNGAPINAFQCGCGCWVWWR